MASDYRTLRTVALAVAALAGWAVAVGLLWSHAERNHDQRRQIRLLMIAETAARTERDQLRQANGTLADLQSRTSGALQELTNLIDARARATAQLSELERAAEVQGRRAKEAGTKGDEILDQLRQLQPKLEDAVKELGTKNAELASVQDAVTAEARLVAELRQRAEEARTADRSLQEALVAKRSELRALELRLASPRTEGVVELPDQQLEPAPLDPELRAPR